jgi:hypothetical protein
MNKPATPKKLTPKQKASADKRARLAKSLKANMRRRKDRGAPSPGTVEKVENQSDRVLKPKA